MPANRNKLRLVKGDLSIADPPRKLDKHGAELWRNVMREYEIADAGGFEMLTQACQALDRAERCREAIDEDGEIVRNKKNAPMREHPLLKHECVARVRRSHIAALGPRC